MSQMSQQNSDVKHSVQQNSDKISLASTLEITSDIPKNSVEKVVKGEKCWDSQDNWDMNVHIDFL